MYILNVHYSESSTYNCYLVSYELFSTEGIGNTERIYVDGGVKKYDLKNNDTYGVAIVKRVKEVVEELLVSKGKIKIEVCRRISIGVVSYGSVRPEYSDFVKEKIKLGKLISSNDSEIIHKWISTDEDFNKLKLMIKEYRN